MKPLQCGLIGCGNICDVYFKAGKRFEGIEIAVCADLLEDRARAKAEEHGVARALTVEQLIADPDIDIIINLTIPKVHGDIGIAALQAGKSVHNEKPLALTREQAAAMLTLAHEKRLRVGCAPDTFMGAGIQTCRNLIDSGRIGEPVSATAFMMCHGHENWHPDPEFFYQPGGGPLFDMGPYYLTALCVLMGPIRRVTASTRITFPTRTVTSEAKRGQVVTVRTPTHLSGVLDFESGAIATMVMSFDVWDHHLPHIEIHGTEGSLSVPDPNCFSGPIRVKCGREGEWEDVPFTHGYADQSRGIGVADMANALRSGRPHRASGELAYHVLDVMHSFDEASCEERHIHIQSTCERPAPLPLGLPDGKLDP